MSDYKSPFCRRTIDTDDLVKKLRSGANHGCCGSQNLGNTCFMNSSIACLSNCTELTTYFLTKKYENDINKKNEEGLGGRLAESWYSLMSDYWNSTQRHGDPSDVKRTVAKKVKKFAGYSQQDSNEFITEFLSLMSEDLNKNSKKEKTYKELSEKLDNESEIDCAKRFWELHVKRNDSIITDLFGGLYKSKVTCPNCHWVSITFDPFNTLTLAIPDPRYSSKTDICLFYIPKYSIRKSLKVVLRINKKDSLDLIAEKMKNINDFKYSYNKVKFISVIDKQLKRFIDGNETYGEKFTFCYNDEGGDAIPLYLLHRDFSAFPRLLFVNKNMKFREFKKKIYYFARKYLKNPLSDGENNQNSEVEDELKKFQEEEIPYSEEKLVRLMDNEYSKMFDNTNLMDDFPYQILIKPRFDSSRSFNLFDGKRNSCEELKEFGINSDDDSIQKLVNEFTSEGNKLCLVLHLNPDSKYVEKTVRFDSCDSKNDPECGRERGPLSLEDCIKFYIEEEHLDRGNEWFCKKCKSKVPASKKIELYYLPRLLMICFKRFDRHYSKNGEYIDFPIDNLDMGNYITGPDIKNSKYDLFAVSQHYGGTGGGHYTAICKNIDGNWYEYDDSSCSRSSADNAKTSAAYVLFYRKKNW